MTDRRLLNVVLATVVGVWAVSADAATRLTYEIGGSPRAITWPAAAMPVEIHTTAEAEQFVGALLGQSTGVWSDASEGSLTFRMRRSEGIQAGQDGRSAIVLRDDLLKNSGVLAYTTTWFDDSGNITESDIQVDRSQIENLGPLLTHELGHSLGFDHSANLSSAMYPYVPDRGILRLDLDDRVALRTAYPGTRAGGTVAGSVESSSGPVWGAQVVALDQSGQPVAATLSNEQGQFRFESLPVGSYDLYAEPLDGPVSRNNLSGVWRRIPGASFATALPDAGGARVEVAESAEHSRVRITLSDLPIELNPKWIGRIDPAAKELVLDSMAVQVSAGERLRLAVGGDGFVSGVTTFEIAGTDVRRVSDFRYGSNYVWAEFEISAEAVGRSAVIVVRSGNENAALTGGLRIEAGDTGGRRRTVGRG